MGSWFSNIYTRKNETATEGTIEKCIGKIMASKHYLPCTSEMDADGAIAIAASEDCCWISIYSDFSDYSCKLRKRKFNHPGFCYNGWDDYGLRRLDC